MRKFFATVTATGAIVFGAVPMAQAQTTVLDPAAGTYTFDGMAELSVGPISPECNLELTGDVQTNNDGQQPSRLYPRQAISIMLSSCVSSLVGGGAGSPTLATAAHTVSKMYDGRGAGDEWEARHTLREIRLMRLLHRHRDASRGCTMTR